MNARWSVQDDLCLPMHRNLETRQCLWLGHNVLARRRLILAATEGEETARAQYDALVQVRRA